MKNFGLWIAFCVFCSSAAQAQYKELLNPQNTQDIQKLKEQKVAMQSAFLEINGSQTPYSIIKFDEAGRIITSVTPKNRRYYTYDADGKIINYIDSAHDGRRFWPINHTFTFTADGKLASYKKDKSVSAFSYDATKRELTETNGSIKTIYRYNEENKLLEQATEGGETHKYLYNKYGDLATEIIAQQNENGTDTTRIMYTFDSKGRLLRKYTSRVQRFNESEDPTNTPTVTRSSQTCNYTYDVRSGLLTGENMISSDPKESCKTAWQYDMNGLLTKETKTFANGKPAQSLIYKYSYDR